MKNIRKQRTVLIRRLIAVLTVVAIGGIGSYFLTASFAATTTNYNPTGYADYCTIENGNTVLYGWAYDPDAPKGPYPYVSLKVGTVSSYVPTDRLNYRDAAINAGLTNSYPSSPHTGEYGWRAVFSSLYKGSTYAVSGSVRNYGSGSATYVTLGINTTHHVDGDVSKPYFAGGVVPDACLIAKPVPPVVVPPPAPTPTPTPTPPPAPKPKPVTKTTTPAASGSPAATPSNAADATVSAGTLGASIKVPAGNASTIHIAYGTSDDRLINSTQDTTAIGSDATVRLESLRAKTTYSYQIIRNNAAGTVSSSTAKFTTKGYSIVIAFQDADGNPLSDIKGSLSDSKTSVTTGKDGKMAFTDLAGGSYTITFNYKGHDHTLDYNTDSVTDAGAPEKVAVLGDSVDVSQFSAKGDPSTQAGAKHSKAGILIGVLLGIVLLAGIIWFVIRRRRNVYDPLAGYTAPPQSMPTVSINQPPAPSPTKLPQPGVLPTTPGPGHESLREMVIRSMHEQAAAKKNQGPPPSP